MIIELIIALLLGCIIGTFTGLIPGIHINLVGTILIGLTAGILSWVNPIFLIVFIASMAITHTFIDFIPSIFLGCPDENTSLSVLPGHEMLKEGKGHAAVMLAAKGGIIAVFILLIVAFPLSFGIERVYNAILSKMFYVLVATSAILIFSEKKKITALIVFLASGLLGFCILNVNLKEPLLPMLTGFFGTSMLLLSIKNKTKLPEQTLEEEKVAVIKPIIGAVIASPLCGFLPGLGSGQAAILGNTISKTDKKGFITLLGTTNILVMGLSFVSLYAISKTRTGAAASIQKLIGILSWKILLLILITCLLSGIISFFLTRKLSGIFIKLVSKINYNYLSYGVIILLIILVFFFSGLLGILVLAATTITGIHFHSLPVKKTNMMGCLLIPTIVYYAMML